MKATSFTFMKSVMIASPGCPAEAIPPGHLRPRFLPTLFPSCPESTLWPVNLCEKFLLSLLDEVVPNRGQTPPRAPFPGTGHFYPAALHLTTTSSRTIATSLRLPRDLYLLSKDTQLVDQFLGGGNLTDSGINQIRMKGALMTGKWKRKFSVIALFVCVIAIALIFLIQTCGFSNGAFYFRHSDNGMYDDATAITAQVAKSSHGFLSFTADPEKACAGTIECLGFGGRDNLATIDSPQPNQTAAVSINLSCTRGKAKVVLYQIESGDYITLVEGTATLNEAVLLPEGTSVIALIGDKADVVCDFEIAANEGALAVPPTISNALKR